jgi:hypothetical protein
MATSQKYKEKRCVRTVAKHCLATNKAIIEVKMDSNVLNIRLLAALIANK